MSESSFIVTETFTFYRRLERLQDYVEMNLAEGISLTTAAAVVGMEPTAFCHFFHRTTGTHFKTWITGLQIAHAQGLFRQKNYSVTEVAYASGFSSLRTFQRVFRQSLGMTPSQFKRRMRPKAGPGALRRPSHKK